MNKVCPVIDAASSLAKNVATEATSSGDVFLLRSVLCFTCFSKSRKFGMPRAAAVLIGPGLIALTRTLCLPNSEARYLVLLSRALFATPTT